METTAITGIAQDGQQELLIQIIPAQEDGTATNGMVACATNGAARLGQPHLEK